MKSEIQAKLLRFLNGTLPFTEECQVVYLLVEVRKILDHENSSTFPILRFYADWSVHRQKDRITPQIRTIMERIRDEIKERQDNRTFVDPTPELIPFVSMDQLKSEMDEFLQKHSLPETLILRDNWLAFRNLLAGVLTDQPINDPCVGITNFAYKPAQKGGVTVEIAYENLAAELVLFRLGGAF
jgi:hypothetical protein